MGAMHIDNMRFLSYSMIFLGIYYRECRSSLLGCRFGRSGSSGFVLDHFTITSEIFFLDL